jgi:hypothetical protein
VIGESKDGTSLILKNDRSPKNLGTLINQIIELQKNVEFLDGKLLFNDRINVALNELRYMVANGTLSENEPIAPGNASADKFLKLLNEAFSNVTPKKVQENTFLYFKEEKFFL